MKILLSVEILIDKIATEETAFLINTLTANGHDVFVVANSNRLDVHDLFELYKNLRSCLPALPQKHILAAKDIHRIPGDIVVSIAPDDFDLNQQMAFRFFYEALDYDKMVETLKNERKFIPAKEALDRANEILETALIWIEKAYNINQNDRQHNIMYRQVLVRLLKPVPEELQEKVDSYYKH